MVYLLDHMNAFNLKHIILCQKDANTYSMNDADSSKYLNVLPVSSSTDELNIKVNEKFDLLPIIAKAGIVRLNLILDDIFVMYKATAPALNTWLKQSYQEGTSKSVGYNIALLMIQFLAAASAYWT